MGRSSFDEVSAFLRQGNAQLPPPKELEEDVELLVRNWERVRNLGEAFSEVELSPFMQSLLQSGDQALTAVDSERASAAAGG